MNNSSLIKLLQAFSKKEISELKEFLASPFFNKRQSVIKLFNIISKYHPEFKSEVISKEKIFEKLFPGKKYNDNLYRVLTHHLTELTKEYLSCSRFRKNTPEVLFHLSKELLDKKQFKLLEKNMEKSFSDLEKADMEAHEYYFFKFRFEFEKMNYFFTASSGVFEKVIDKTNQETVFKELTNFYLIKSMVMYLNTLTLRLMYNKDLSVEAFQKIISAIAIEDYDDIPVIKLYYNLIKMITDNEDESHFFKVREIMSLSKKKINRFDIIGAYVTLNNYCTKKIHEGKTKFEKHKFEIYKEELIEKTYLMSDGYMSPTFYRNVVSSALSLKEYEWVLDFINKYKEQLHKEYRENYYSFCMAYYEFSLKNFESALEYNARIVYDELYLKLNSKTLQLQLLYELGKEETFLSALESFRHFISNNKLIPDVRKIFYYNFHKSISRLFKIKNKNDMSETSSLKSETAGTQNISNKEWLLSKIDEIKNRSITNFLVMPLLCLC